MITMNGLVASYQVESLSMAIKRIARWLDEGLVSEKEVAALIIQLFHQIPEDTYNDIIEKEVE